MHAAEQRHDWAMAHLTGNDRRHALATGGACNNIDPSYGKEVVISCRYFHFEYLVIPYAIVMSQTNNYFCI